ncbi:MAG TPA: hypothetical protein DC058_13335 [Planctomycetaceae bacterium]|nr:hypothetical protein [Planctomycetaceae bacterium]
MTPRFKLGRLARSRSRPVAPALVTGGLLIPGAADDEAAPSGRPFSNHEWTRMRVWFQTTNEHE